MTSEQDTMGVLQALLEQLQTEHQALSAQLERERERNQQQHEEITSLREALASQPSTASSQADVARLHRLQDELLTAHARMSEARQQQQQEFSRWSDRMREGLARQRQETENVTYLLGQTQRKLESWRWLSGKKGIAAILIATMNTSLTLLVGYALVRDDPRRVMSSEQAKTWEMIRSDASSWRTSLKPRRAPTWQEDAIWYALTTQRLDLTLSQDELLVLKTLKKCPLPKTLKPSKTVSVKSK